MSDKRSLVSEDVVHKDERREESEEMGRGKGMTLLFLELILVIRRICPDFIHWIKGKEPIWRGRRRLKGDIQKVSPA